MLPAQNITILIIEDNPIDQVVLRENIKRTKLATEVILTASTIRDAIDILENHKTGIIFLDLFLPDSTGLESFESIVNRFPGIPVIICSSLSDSEITLKAITLGAQDFLIKGHYDFDLLEKTILYSIERKKNLEIIRESNDRYNAIFNGVNDAIILSDDDGKIVQANPGAIQILGYSPEELYEQPLVKFLCNPPLSKNGEQEQTAGQPQILELKTKSGNTVICMCNSENNILPGLHLSILTDITERKKAEEALQASFNQIQLLAERQTAIINSLPFHIIVLDENAQIVEVNHAAQEYSIINPLIVSNELIGENYIEIAERAGSEGLSTGKKLPKAIRSVNAGNEKEYTHEYACLSGNDQVWFRVNITRLNKKGKAGVVISHANITERKKSEDQIQASNEQLRLLASHLQNIREEERANIAREIHDELGQQLTGLKFDMAWVNKKIQGNDKMVAEKISGLLEMIDNAINTVRRISTDLRPGILDDFGLQAAMEWQAGEFTKRTGIACCFKTTFQTDISDKNITIALFRIFQESLTNVVRHSQAKNVYANLMRESDLVILTIEDDGIGMDMEIAQSKRRLGLMGMKERSYMVNGSCTIISKPGRGTTITVVVPYTEPNS
jgi:PAS domain S-box-containing protein